MSIAILERESTRFPYEVSVDTAEELLFLNEALSGIIGRERLSDDTDEHRLQAAEALRERVEADVVEVLGGVALSKLSYPIEEASLVLEAIEIEREVSQAQDEKKIHYPEYDWLYNRDNTYPANTKLEPPRFKLYRD